MCLATQCHSGMRRPNVKENIISLAKVWPLQDIAVVQPQSVGGRAGKGGACTEPRHCVLLRAGGIMTVLDLDQGAPSV